MTMSRRALFGKLDLTLFRALESATAFAKLRGNLMKYCLTGKHVAEAVLTVRKAGGSPLEYLKLTMSDVIVTGVRPFGAAEDDVRVKERVRLSFAKIKQEYNVQNAQGGSGGAVTAGYDIKANKEA